MSHVITASPNWKRLYGMPSEASTVKEVDWLTPHYRAYIEASPFAALATSGPEGLDCSPRGDRPGFVRVHDEQDADAARPARQQPHRFAAQHRARSAGGAAVPDPGRRQHACASTAAPHLSVEPDLLASFAVEDKAPRSVTVIERRYGLLPVRPRAGALGAVEPGAPRRSAQPAERRPDPGRAERRPRRRRSPTIANGRAAPPRRCGERARPRARHRARLDLARAPR